MKQFQNRITVSWMLTSIALQCNTSSERPTGQFLLNEERTTPPRIALHHTTSPALSAGPFITTSSKDVKAFVTSWCPLRRMGTGVNCSYSVSNGTYVPLLCDEGVLFCCTSSASTGAVFCSKANCSASGLANEATNTDITAYIFWVILAASGAVTIIVLILSYAVCRFRKPGCADASTLRDQFLEEHILAAQLRSGTTLGNNTPANSATPFSTSPPNGLTPASSPDLLVHPNRSNGHIGQDQGRPHAHVVPSKIPVPNAAVNRAFVMSAEAFSKKPVKVQRSSVKGRPFASKGVDYSSHTDMASPRLVHVGGITPRVPLRDKGRTESKQTILSRDESLTAVET